MLTAASMAKPSRKAADDRQRWAHPSRDRVSWGELTRGERSRRVKFARLVSLGVQADVAIRDVLDLALGPVPGLQTQEEFDAMWAPDQVVEIASRWLRAGHFRTYAKDETDVARAKLASWAGRFAETLKEIADDPKATPTARVKAAQIGLGLAGICAGDKPLADLMSLKEKLRRRTRAIVECEKRPVAVLPDLTPTLEDDAA